MMRRIIPAAITLLFGLVAAGLVWTWTPVLRFDTGRAIAKASTYDPHIIRDRYGVPHIYGARDVDVAFGLAYAHAEDDWATFEEAVRFSRGTLAASVGRSAALTDYLVAALDVWPTIKARYEADLAPETRMSLQAYADGLNFWCAENRGRCRPGVAPITAEDIVAGFSARTPFFYGLEDILAGLFEPASPTRQAFISAREAYLRLPADLELGSNAMAAAPQKMSDGSTRLIVNSHQPFSGPVAWYEARVKSGEGWDMIGGVFPGSPFILHGANPDLGWAFTVNKPDLVDVYRLETDRTDMPRRYRFDGGWRDLEVRHVTIRVKLFGPLSLPVRRPVYRSVHGPVFDTPTGFVAVAFAGDRDLRAAEQWRRMNKARTHAAWQEAMAIQGIPSFHVVYADRTGTIAYYYNAAIPRRSPEWDWTMEAPGDRPDLVWSGTMPFGTAPSMINPASGFVVNANNSPFEATTGPSAPSPTAFPANLGIDRRSTNRGMRALQLYGADASMTPEAFLAHKMDHRYADQSRLVRLIEEIVEDRSLKEDETLARGVNLLANWDRNANKESREAALAILTGQGALGFLLNGEKAPRPQPRDALVHAMNALEAGFGRIDPTWGEVNRLKRGNVDVPLNGGPDTLRAIYALGDVADGPLTAVAGDTYIMDVVWSSSGEQAIRTIHQFGSATLDASSSHYADQAPIFAREEWKTPALTLEGVSSEATRDYMPTKTLRGASSILE